MNKKFIWLSLANAVATFAYIALMSWFLFNGEHWFGNQPDNFFMPLLMLLLLVISATITGVLVLGKPIQLFLDNHKKDAITMLFMTLAWLLAFSLVVVLFLMK